MKQLILTLCLICSISVKSNQIDQTPNSPVDLCSPDKIMPTGGHDHFPWSIAKPFPWTTIQGVWAPVNKAQSNTLFQFKVTRTTDNIKQLFVEIYSGSGCDKKVTLQGVGVMNNIEKNVVRVNINNTLLKLALFDTQDLEMNSLLCGPKALGATFYTLDSDIGNKLIDDKDIDNIESNSNTVLKKISNLSTYKCK